jgi:hypothetical protein
MYAPLVRSDYYGASATYWSRQPTTGLPTAWLVASREGRFQHASHVHHSPVDERAAQLYPDSIATPTPQAFSVASSPASRDRLRSRRPTNERRALQPAQTLQIGAGGTLTGRQTLVPLVRRLVLLAGPAPSGSTDASRRRQGCSYLPVRLHGSAALSFTGLLRQSGGRGLAPLPGNSGASWRTSTLFHFDVPGGMWQTVICRPVSAARAASSVFQARVRWPLDPPASAVISSRVACGSRAGRGPATSGGSRRPRTRRCRGRYPR